MTIRQRIAAFFTATVNLVLPEPMRDLPDFNSIQLVELRGGPFCGETVAVYGLASTHTQITRECVYDYELASFPDEGRLAVFECVRVTRMEPCGQYEEGAKQ